MRGALEAALLTVKPTTYSHCTAVRCHKGGVCSTIIHLSVSDKHQVLTHRGPMIITAKE